MGIRLGFEAKLYRNTGDFATPVWVEMTNVKDLTLNLEKGEVDATTRGNNGWEAIVAGLKRGSIEFEMVWDTQDAGFTAIQEAFFNDTAIEVAAMDGDITAAGTQGLRASMEVINFSRSEPLEEALTVSVTIKPAYSANPPQWMKVAA
jgi:predicted secreted protein